MAYFDLFVAPVETSRRAEYEEFLKHSHAAMLGFGASRIVDFWQDDVPEGELTSFAKAVKLKEGESVAVGYVIWPSKEARDAGWSEMMADETPMQMPFDGKRMFFGGFSEMLSTEGEET